MKTLINLGSISVESSPKSTATRKHINITREWYRWIHRHKMRGYMCTWRGALHYWLWTKSKSWYRWNHSLITISGWWVKMMKRAAQTTLKRQLTISTKLCKSQNLCSKLNKRQLTANIPVVRNPTAPSYSWNHTYGLLARDLRTTRLKKQFRSLIKHSSLQTIILSSMMA